MKLTKKKNAPRFIVFQVPTHFSLKDLVQQKGRVDMPGSFFRFRHIRKIRQHLSSLHNLPAATSHRLWSIQLIGGSKGGAQLGSQGAWEQRGGPLNANGTEGAMAKSEMVQHTQGKCTASCPHPHPLLLSWLHRWRVSPSAPCSFTLCADCFHGADRRQ